VEPFPLPTGFIMIDAWRHVARHIRLGPRRSARTVQRMAISALDALDGLSTSPPRDPYVDPESGIWTLSRYEDVLSAFRDVRLLPNVAPRDNLREPRDANGGLISRSELRDALSGPRLGEWRERVHELANQGLGEIDDPTLAELHAGDSVDLLHDFALPWCLSIGMMATGANPADRDTLAQLGSCVFAATGASHESSARADAKAAVAELDRYFLNAPVPMMAQTFIGMSQTTPRLLASGWLALFTYPVQAACLRADRSLAPRASEELLRYAGIIVRLLRIATADVVIRGARIEAGEQVELRIASANRDPDQYTDPDRLDVSRRVLGQLTLGIGRHSCVGARLVRLVSEVGTAALLRRFSDISVESAAWRVGSGFRWPTAARFVLRH
jgi:cytochrome P450